MISVSLHGGHLRVRSPDIIFRVWAPALSPRLYWVQSGGVLVELDALLRTGRSPLCALRMWVELRWLSLCGACALVCVFWFVCCLLTRSWRTWVRLGHLLPLGLQCLCWAVWMIFRLLIFSDLTQVRVLIGRLLRSDSDGPVRGWLCGLDLAA